MNSRHHQIITMKLYNPFSKTNTRTTQSVEDIHPIILKMGKKEEDILVENEVWRRLSAEVREDLRNISRVPRVRERRFW